MFIRSESRVPCWSLFFTPYTLQSRREGERKTQDKKGKQQSESLYAHHIFQINLFFIKDKRKNKLHDTFEDD